MLVPARLLAVGDCRTGSEAPVAASRAPRLTARSGDAFRATNSQFESQGDSDAGDFVIRFGMQEVIRDAEGLFA
jgi:hypothetical protein